MLTMPLLSLNTRAADFKNKFSALLERQQDTAADVLGTVEEIIAAVRERGDEALLAYSRRFDRLKVTDVTALEIPQLRLQQALQTIDPQLRTALQQATKRIETFHLRQREESWQYCDPDGTVLGQQITPLDRVGLYVPGGRAAYPSSVLMTAIPARVAGVGELIMAAPTPDDQLNDTVLAAAALTGVDRVFRIGGAQAIAALAYGTATIPAVDKIVGPGNSYVATAKAMVFGKTGIDMIAGPSEVVVVGAGEVNPDWLAMDLFAQAEHDEQAQAIFISPESELVAKVAAAIDRLLPGMPRQHIIRKALNEHGALIHCTDLDEAVTLVNRIAPEHLELAVPKAQIMAQAIRHAGAIFMGSYSAEALGDYCAGPNHVLPTAGTARFSSPLGVYDFQKRTSLIGCSPAGAATLAAIAAPLAQAEGLTAHAQSAAYRQHQDG